MKRLSVLGALLIAAFACQAQTQTAPETPQPPVQPAAAEAPAVPQEPEAVPEPEGAKLVIKDTRVGKGREAASGDMVRVHYTGWLYNFNARDGKGRKFDSSRDRGQPLELPIGVGKVIKGWDQGIVGMKVGGRRTLVIPPELGYGARTMGNGIIPANSTLMFDVELVGIK
ncbi:FKBP-type peptidyl-prolyl cis-trans isomerase [Pseudoduganella rhizocola]|uniref:FKBP-type peptidyl-prolyl cis-trans isomerase n=1 Tax=Pseudoduganella rhizocola TaxID=3382643 RepID=UPI0038B4D816